jgi:hypothetical protein
MITKYEFTIYKPEAITAHGILAILKYLYYSDVETALLNEINIELN